MKSFETKHKNCNAKRGTIIPETSDKFKLSFNAYRENLSTKYDTQSESDRSCYRIYSWYRTTNMRSPVPPTQDKILQIILSKLTNLELGMSKLSIENGHRIEEIVQLRNRIGISARLQTDVGENVITSDSEDFDGIESENRGIRVSIGENAQNRTNIADESQDTARQRTQLTVSRNTTFVTIPAKEIIRAIRTLTGHDDIGVEDFIRSVERAQEKFSQPDLLLEFI